MNNLIATAKSQLNSSFRKPYIKPGTEIESCIVLDSIELNVLLRRKQRKM